MDNSEQLIESFLLPFGEAMEAHTQQLRIYIKELTKPTTELVGPSTISLNIGYGFTRKPWDCYCAIIVYSKHINISFPSGTSLKDPNELLQGKGSRIRHIRAGSLEELKKPAVVDLLIQARDIALALADESDRKIDQFKTFVKAE